MIKRVCCATCLNCHRLACYGEEWFVCLNDLRRQVEHCVIDHPQEESCEEWEDKDEKLL